MAGPLIPLFGAAVAAFTARKTYERSKRLADVGVDEDILTQIFTEHGVDLTAHPELVRGIVKLQGRAGYDKEQFSVEVGRKLLQADIEEPKVEAIVTNIRSREPLKITAVSFAIEGVKSLQKTAFKKAGLS